MIFGQERPYLVSVKYYKIILSIIRWCDLIVWTGAAIPSKCQVSSVKQQVVGRVTNTTFEEWPHRRVIGATSHHARVRAALTSAARAAIIRREERVVDLCAHGVRSREAISITTQPITQMCLAIRLPLSPSRKCAQQSALPLSPSRKCAQPSARARNPTAPCAHPPFAHRAGAVPQTNDEPRERARHRPNVFQ